MKYSSARCALAGRRVSDRTPRPRRTTHWRRTACFRPPTAPARWDSCRHRSAPASWCRDSAQRGRLRLTINRNRIAVGERHVEMALVRTQQQRRRMRRGSMSRLRRHQRDLPHNFARAQIQLCDLRRVPQRTPAAAAVAHSPLHRRERRRERTCHGPDRSAAAPCRCAHPAAPHRRQGSPRSAAHRHLSRFTTASPAGYGIGVAGRNALRRCR